MAGRSKPSITDGDIAGLKYFEKLLSLFERLREVGFERDTASNRDLHFDEYYCLVLLIFVNPMVDSMRALQQASKLKAVQKMLEVPRVLLGSFSESRPVFDPELLKPIIGELAQQARPLARDPRLHALTQLRTLVDGTLLIRRGGPRMAEVSLLKRQTGITQNKMPLDDDEGIKQQLPDQKICWAANRPSEITTRAALAAV